MGHNRKVVRACVRTAAVSHRDTNCADVCVLSAPSQALQSTTRLAAGYGNVQISNAMRQVLLAWHEHLSRLQEIEQ